MSAARPLQAGATWGRSPSSSLTGDNRSSIRRSLGGLPTALTDLRSRSLQVHPSSAHGPRGAPSEGPTSELRLPQVFNSKQQVSWRPGSTAVGDGATAREDPLRAEVASGPRRGRPSLHPCSPLSARQRAPRAGVCAVHAGRSLGVPGTAHLRAPRRPPIPDPGAPPPAPAHRGAPGSPWATAAHARTRRCSFLSLPLSVPQFPLGVS